MRELPLLNLNNSAIHAREMSKTASCFICGREYPRDLLAQHEKDCLDNIQTNDTQYTRDAENDSTLSAHSVRSANSTSSTGSGKAGEKKYDRCYICGSDVPSYLSATHERSCKRNWELGLLNSASGSLRKTTSRGSLSRGGSGTDLRSAPLRKTKSSSNVGADFFNVSHDIVQDGKRAHTGSQGNLSSRAVSASPARPVSASTDSRKTPSKSSRSTSNLQKPKSSGNAKPAPFKAGKYTPDWKSKSLQDIRGTPPNKNNTDAEKKKKSSSMPQYIICQYCGKLYSVHSIAIHQPQCERTIFKQKKAGIDVDTKRKSKSVSDIAKLGAKSKSSISRNISTEFLDKSATDGPRSTASLDRNRPASASKKTPQRSNSANSARSSSRPFFGRLPRPFGSSEKRSVPSKASSSSSVSSPFSPTSPSSADDSVFDDTVQSQAKKDKDSDGAIVSPGFQKCYLCGQLYGSRSLPIHEKQCLKKWERQAKEDKAKEKAKRKEKREIQLIPFGKAKIPNENGKADAPNRSLSVPNGPLSPGSTYPASPAPSPASPVSPSNSLFQEEPTSLFKRTFLGGDEETNADDGSTMDPTASPRFVMCVYCGRQYGHHSIIIHERSCRERQGVEQDTRGRLQTVGEEDVVQENGLHLFTDHISKDEQPPSPTSPFANGDAVQLVTCVDCKRRFLSTDIERHQLRCRLSLSPVTNL